MKRRDLIKKLEEAGFRFKEHGGNHDTYKRGSDTEQVPRHRNKRDHSKADTEKMGIGLIPCILLPDDRR